MRRERWIERGKAPIHTGRQTRTGIGTGSCTETCEGSRPGAPEQGASLAEFALVLPVLLMILFGIIEFGFAFSRAQSIEAAAREGGRLASLSASSSADVQDRVDQTLGMTTFDSVPEVTIVPSGGCAGREGQSVTVTVQATHRLTIPFVAQRDITLTGHSVYRCEA